MKTPSKIIMLIACISLFISCAKDGEIGPQGPAGSNGAANIQNYSLTISPGQWTYDNVYERWYYRYNSSANSNSLVYSYVFSGSGKQLMPYYSCLASMAWCYQFDLANVLYSGYLEFQYTNYVSRTTAPTSDKSYDFIIVPPAQRNDNLDVNWENYEEVKATFNLPD